jgi:hypothetical protein
MSKSRAYVFTWNNPPDDYVSTLDALEVKYIVAGRELAASGTPHLQGFVYFRNARSQRSVRGLLPGCHVEVARGTPAQADEYCRKEDLEPYSRGTRPISSQEKGENEKARWEEAWTLAKEGKLEEIPFLFFILNLAIVFG